MRYLIAVSVLGTLSLLPSCRDASGPAGPAAIMHVSEPSVVGPVGAARSVVVRATAADGRAAPNVLVTWAATGGGGAVDPGTNRTDGSGEAATTWTLGTVPGQGTLTATVRGLPPITFTATIEAGPPANIAAQVQLPGAGPVGGPIAPAPAVIVRDAYQNPVAGVTVEFVVTAGGGSVSGAQPVTDGGGIAAVDAWTLGTVAGANTLTATVAGLEPFVFSATAQADTPATVAASAGAGETATVGTAVATPPAVIVRDRHGNPVPDVPVDFAVATGGGSVTGAEQTTDTAGIARIGGWTLGTTAGPNTLTAAVAGLEAVVFTATGVAGAPAAMDIHEGDQQTAAPGSAVPVPPAVRVADAHGNPVGEVPVTFVAGAGGGTVTGAEQSTDPAGIARVGGWTLGEQGTNTLAATAPALPALTFSAWADQPAFNIFIEAVHLNQGNQTLHGTIGGVANRPGLLRVVVRADEVNSHTPPVRIRLFDGATMLREELVPAPGIGVPTDPDLARASDTWNLQLSASDVVPGLAVEAVVDPEGTIPVNNSGDNRFPRGGGSASLDVSALPPLRILFIPIHATVQERTGDVSNVGAYLDPTWQWIPSSELDVSVRETYTTSLDLSSPAAWPSLVAEIQAVRTAEGAVDQYYHGIVGDFPGIPVSGSAYVPSSPGSPFRSAISFDRPFAAASVIAHELGHNLGREHSPCGGAPDADPAYPHADGRLGFPGFDIALGTLQADSDLRDYMGYCDPRWTSDYTYGAILDWRRQDPLAQPGAMADVHRTSGLLVWGRIHPGGVELSPAFSLDAIPSLPDRPGPNQLHGTAADGRVLFRISFEGTRLAHGPDTGERHFAYFVPLAPDEIDALARIELATPSSRAARVARARARPEADAATGPALIERAAGDRLRVRWDAARYPMAMVRDTRTGRILAFARAGDMLLPAGTATPGQVEVFLSDGLTTRRDQAR